MKQKAATLVLFFIYLCNASVAQIVYTTQDSLRIEHILQQTKGDYLHHIATEFAGTPYIASTLDSTECERLIINTRQMDCTTFMETVVALALTANANGSFTDFCRNIQTIRYRKAQCNEYSDRLHYITQWIDDNRQKGIVEEIITPQHTATQRLCLNFMSTHPQSYSQLKNNPAAVAKIESHEAPYRDIDIKYIPKNRLRCPQDSLEIREGDILAIVTAIKGLDVTHVGFATWINDTLHLIHASSGKGEVIVDPVPLYDYMKTKKNNLGIRVVRVKLE